MYQRNYAIKYDNDLVEITETTDNYGSHYIAKGRLLPIAAYVKRIFDVYPTPGYGTWSRMTGLDIDTQMVTVEIRHSNSCD